MASGMWTAVSGASAQAQRLDTIANNLANADSNGFKKDATTFKEYLATVERDKHAQDIPRGAIKDKDFYQLDGRDNAAVLTHGTHTIFEQGSLKSTNHQLDIALDGPGFLEVSTPYGVMYTRFGNLKIAQDGRLITTDGLPLLADKPGGINSNSTDPAARFINIRDHGLRFSINAQGEIYSGENLVAKLSIVEFKDKNHLKKVGMHLFEEKKTPKIPQDNKLQSPNTIVRQGYIETSNVNPIEEMANMIKANRLFEQDMKALKTYGELMGKEANDIGKL